MFPGFSFNHKEISCSTEEQIGKGSEDDHYDEHEESYGPLDDGIDFDESIIDEYEEHFDDELENDTLQFEDLENITSTVDDLEIEHYDSLEEDEE